MSSTESESEKSERLSISSDSVYDSVAYDPVKTMLSESEIEAGEPTNHKARNRTLPLVYSSASTFFHLIVSDGVLSRISDLLPTLSV